ncbi:glycosyltransferase [Serratia marcescens]|uniref:glycosyltransferase n=1 Tax=Serratia marcescens TaxID=615 RepID=UPI00356B71C0
MTAKNGDSEGLPTVILEASANKVPVIGTLHAGIPEAIIDGGTWRYVLMCIRFYKREGFICRFP